MASNAVSPSSQYNSPMKSEFLVVYENIEFCLLLFHRYIHHISGYIPSSIWSSPPHVPSSRASSTFADPSPSPFSILAIPSPDQSPPSFGHPFLLCAINL